MVDCVCVLDESGCASRATLSAVPVRDSLIFVPVDLVDWGCCWHGLVVWGLGGRGGGGAYQGLAELGVGVFAEGVGHGEGFGWVVWWVGVWMLGWRR